MADIELLIKIPEDVYKASQIIDAEHEDVIQIPLEIIKNGTRLTKGYGILKDVDAIENLSNDDYVIDQIKKEFIDRYPKNYMGGLELDGCSCEFSLNTILSILDKYKKEKIHED